MSSFHLDTLVQPSYNIDTGKYHSALRKTITDLKTKAGRIKKTFDLIYPLIDLNSDMEGQYWQAYHCCREVVQEGVYLHFRYCNKRFCFVCNSIRAAKMINGYLPIFNEFKYPQFVTLTRRNVKAKDLEKEIDDIIHEFTKLVHYIKRYRKLQISGIRKIEVTYNWRNDTYHPHLHLIVDSYKTAVNIRSEWMIRNEKRASWDAQHIEKADKGSMIELFKYSVKTISDLDISLYAQDHIFRCLRGRRIYQPFGLVRKVGNLNILVCEDIPEKLSQAYGSLDPVEYRVWYFNNEAENWNSIDGRFLTDVLIFNSS